MDFGSASILAAGGVISGLVAGMSGAGGGYLLVPFLIWFLQANGVSSLVSTHVAFGTSLWAVALSTSASALIPRRQMLVIWRAVPALGLAGIAGALAGSTIAGGLEGTALRRCFAAVAVVSAVRLMTGGKKGRKAENPKLALPGLAGTGILLGLVSSLTGVGGEDSAVSIMKSALRFPVKQAVGTSRAILIITAVAASAGYILAGRDNPFLPAGTLGFVDPLRVLPVVAGAIPAAFVGARLAGPTLSRAYGVLLLIIAFRMFFL
jgi:uncharacterized membrane protein YfcA